MDLGLKGKVAIVAASSKGMGKATAMGLAAEGARVTMLARHQADLQQAAEEIRERCRAEVLAVPADVTKYDDIKRAVEETATRWGTVNILVTNAGGPPAGVFDDMDDAKWQAAFELNLLSTIRLVREVLPHMRRAGGGVIMTDRLRQVMGARAQAAGKAFEDMRQSREAEIPLGRIGDPEDVANMIVFLASDRARYVTGVTVQVDGGLVRSIM